MGFEEVDSVHLPHISFKEKLYVAKEKALHGRAVSDDPHDITIGFGRLRNIRDELRDLETALKKWLASSRSLAKSSANLAKKMPVEQRTYTELSSGMTEDLRNDAALRAISSKISAIDTLIKDRNVLHDLHYLKHRRERKLQGAKEEASRARRAALDSVAKDQYDTLCEELRTALHAVVDNADKDGLGALVGKELSAFKEFQHEFFAHAQHTTEARLPISPGSGQSLSDESSVAASPASPFPSAASAAGDELSAFGGDAEVEAVEQPRAIQAPPTQPVTQAPPPVLLLRDASATALAAPTKDAATAWPRGGLVVMLLLLLALVLLTVSARQHAEL